MGRSAPRRPRRHEQILVGAAACLLIAASAGRATSLYSGQATGSGASRAATIPTPPAPTIVDTTGVFLACRVDLSWSAPPAGEQYTIRRTIGATTVVVAGPTASAGSTTDTVLLSLLNPSTAPSYATTAHWTTAPAWTAVSAPAVASGCLELL